MSPGGNDINLREVAQAISAAFGYARKKSSVILVSVLIGIIVSYYFYSQDKIVYTASVTFMVNKPEGNSGIGSMLSSFGLGGLGKDGGVNLDRILEISESPSIIYPALLDSTEINGKIDRIGNHILTLTNVLDVWNSKREIVPPNFKFSNSIDLEERMTGLVMQKLRIYLTHKKSNPRVFTASYDEDTEILKLSTKFEEPQLAEKIVYSIYKQLSEYYIANSIQPQLTTYEVIQSKVDSLSSRTASLEYNIAKARDATTATMLARDRVKSSRLTRELQVTLMALGKATENKELAEFALRTNTPFFQVISFPELPLLPTAPSLLRYLLAGVILASFFSFFGLIFHYFYLLILTPVESKFASAA